MNAKKTFFMLCVLFSCTNYSMQKPPERETYLQKNERLKILAQRYTDFLNQCGKEFPGDIMSPIAQLFSDECIKRVNGRIACASHAQLKDHILASKHQTGTWNVVPISPDIICTDEKMNRAFISTYYEVQTLHCGALIAMHRLQVDDENKITWINEVCAKRELSGGTYH